MVIPVFETMILYWNRALFRHKILASTPQLAPVVLSIVPNENYSPITSIITLDRSSANNLKKKKNASHANTKTTLDKGDVPYLTGTHYWLHPLCADCPPNSQISQFKGTDSHKTRRHSTNHTPSKSITNMYYRAVEALGVLWWALQSWRRPVAHATSLPQFRRFEPARWSRAKCCRLLINLVIVRSSLWKLKKMISKEALKYCVVQMRH